MAEVPVNNHLINIDDWQKRSQAGAVCGILGCAGKPITKCGHCGSWYCLNHDYILELPSHARKEI